MVKKDLVYFPSMSVFSIVVYVVFITDFGTCNNYFQFSAVGFCWVVTMAA
jgi:hypothetical protein